MGREKEENLGVVVTLGLPRVQRSARIRLRASKLPAPAAAAAAAAALAAAAPAEKRRDCAVEAMWLPQIGNPN